MSIKLGSLFDGIGGFPYSGIKFGITPAWASEIEPWPIKVTQKHFPGMKHLGDITQINGGEIEPVDIITFGSPCQDLSVAGKREGLAGARSGLFMDAIRIIREMRTATDGQYPRFAVWENVPGAYSSNSGQDFRAVLEEITETEIPMPPSGKWGRAGMVRTERVDVAWRTLDAQYWGVPQRRRRIFLVADFGGQCATEILFKPESLRGDFAESGEAREEAAGNVENSTEKSSCLTPWDVQSKRIHDANGKWPTLYSHQGGGGAHGYVATGIIPFDTTQITSPQNGNNPKPSDPYHPLCANAHVPSIAIPQTAMCINTKNNRFDAESQTFIIEPRSQDGVCRVHNDGIVPTLNTAQGGQRQPCVCIQNATRGKSQNGLGVSQDDVSYTLDSLGNHAVVAPTVDANINAKWGSNQWVDQWGNFMAHYAVRRLTPLECERLQGFPDNWTNIEGCSDTARYKAIGNSVAIPCVMFVLGGIARVLGGEKK